MKTLILVSLALASAPLFADPTNSISCSIQPGITGTCAESGSLDYSASVQVSAITAPASFPPFLNFSVDETPPPGAPGYEVKITLDVFGSSTTSFGDAINVNFDVPSTSGNWAGYGVTGEDFTGGGDFDPISGGFVMDSGPSTPEAGYGGCCAEGDFNTFEFFHTPGQAISAAAGFEVSPISGRADNEATMTVWVYDLDPVPEPSTWGLMLIGVIGAVSWARVRSWGRY